MADIALLGSVLIFTVIIGVIGAMGVMLVDFVMTLRRAAIQRDMSRATAEKAR